MAESQRAARIVENESFVIKVDRAIYRFARRWLVVFNLVALTLASLPLLTPYLASRGVSGVASGLHSFFGLICHQLPEHSFMVFGHHMALCHRCTAIYSATFVAGMAYYILRRRIAPIGFTGFFLLATPMAVDGLTQLVGLRESTWELRLLTGSLFAVGLMWFVLPRLESGFAEIRSVVEQRFEKLVLQGRCNPL